MRAFVLFTSLIISFFLRGETITPIVPNGDFENWTITSYSFPENYLFNSNAFKASSHSPSNVLMTSDAYHGKSAVKLVTDSTSNSINFGFIVGSNGENGDPTTWKGGIPITQPITGIRGWYKYDFVQPDSAMIIVTYRYHGTFLATYEFFLKEKKSQYTLFEFNIVPTWDAAISPDSVIVGFASSGNADNGAGQPGSVLYLDSISFKGMTTQPEALNGDFERWTQHITPILKEWSISNSEVESDWRSTDKYEGNWAVKLSTYKNVGDNNHFEERTRALFLGNYDDQTGNWSNGIHLGNMNDTLSFWYKYLPATPNDMGSVMLMLIMDNKPYTGFPVTIPAASQYQEMKIPLNKLISQFSYPRELVLMFQSSLQTDSTLTHVGSTLLLDHISILPYKGQTGPVLYKPNPPLMNEGFEIWDIQTYENPEFYPFTSNQFRIGGLPYNATKTTFAQHGSYALRLETDGLTNMANFGFVINQNPTSENPANWTGGIPISEKPTGIQGYYTFHAVGADSAMIMIHFRKGGSNIGTYYLFLQPAAGDWVAFNKPFLPELTETPDSMILTIASGGSLSGINPIGSMLMIDNISLTGVTSQPAKLNGDFENWESHSIESAPGWITSDQDNPGVHRSSQAAIGNYAMELKSKAYTGSDGLFQTEPMWLSNGFWDRNTQDWAGGSPINTMLDTLAFYYWYRPAVADDTAQVHMMFKYQGHFVDGNGGPLLPNTGWQYREIEFLPHRNMPTMADSVILLFQSSLWDHKDPRFDGSALLLDDIHFKSSRNIVGLQARPTSERTLMSPNPTEGITNIRFKNAQPVDVAVYNLSGQKILELGRISQETNLDLSKQPAGLYIVKIIGSKNTETLKLIRK